MYASRSRFPKEQDQYQGRDVVPLVTKEWAGDAGPVRDLDAEPARRRGGPAIRPARSAPANAPADEPPVSARPSFGRRVVRRLFRFVVTIMIGVGLTLGLQMHGNEVRDAARIWAPALASMLDGLLPVIASTGASTSSTVAAPATFSDLVQQVSPMQQDLAGVRRSIEELSARQDQMVQAIAALQAAGQDIRQKLVQPPAQPAPAAPAHRPAQPKSQSSAQSSSAGQQSLAPSAGPPAPSPWPTR